MKQNHSFTELFLKNLKPREREFCISEGHGFTIRILPSGVKTFWYYYSLNGKRRKLNLGNYPDVKLSDAREKFRSAANMVAKKIDPQTLPSTIETEIMTVTKLKKLYIEHITGDLVDRSVKHQENRLEKHVISVWSQRPITEIRRRDAIELIENISSKTPGAARNVLMAARSMFTYALRREMVEYNPFSEVGLAVPSALPNERERTLSDEELKKVVLPYLLSPDGNTLIKNALLLILTTGQRPGEITEMHRKEIDGDWWIIPWQRIKTERRKGKKNPRDHRVYLTPLAKSFLLPFEEFLFPACRRALGPIRTNTLSHHITLHDPPFFGLPRWTPHDLRRTARTGMAALKVPERHAEAVLNHSLEGVKRIYDRHHYDKEKKAALSKWSKHLEKLIGEMPKRHHP
jgi:integrase